MLLKDAHIKTDSAALNKFPLQCYNINFSIYFGLV